MNFVMGGGMMVVYLIMKEIMRFLKNEKEKKLREILWGRNEEGWKKKYEENGGNEKDWMWEERRRNWNRKWEKVGDWWGERGDDWNEGKEIWREWDRYW